MTIDTLPDDVLLDVFELHVNCYVFRDSWDTLVHVCRRWRSLVFASPRRLRLQLVCTDRTPVRKMLNIWPDWPVVVKTWNPSMLGMDNLLAALEHNDRVCEADLHVFQDLQVEKVLSAIQKPFPELTHLTFHWSGQELSIFPDSFLAPRLQKLQLFGGIPSPALRKLLLSATDIVTLYLGDLSHSAYISPEEFATCLSVMTRLKHLSLESVPAPSRPDLGNRHSPPSTRIVVSNLTDLIFRGVSEYLEDLVARIDAPRLNLISIEFFDEPVLETLQLVQFIRRTPAFRAFKEVRVCSFNSKVEDKVSLPLSNKQIKLEFSSRWSGFQITSLMQVCNPSFPVIRDGHVECLYIFGNRSLPFSAQGRDEENPPWLELFRPYIAVQDLYISNDLAPRVVTTLQDLVGERVTKVLPFLRKIYVQDLQESSELVQEAFRRFATARQLYGRPVTVHHWKPINPSGINAIVRNLTSLP